MMCLQDTPSTTLRRAPGQKAHWDSDLQQYLASAAASLSPGEQSTQSVLLADLRAQPESASAWWSFLQHEETRLASGELTGGALPSSALPRSFCHQ